MITIYWLFRDVAFTNKSVVKFNVVAAYRSKRKVNGEGSKCSGALGITKGGARWLYADHSCMYCAFRLYRGPLRISGMVLPCVKELWKLTCAWVTKCAGKGICLLQCGQFSVHTGGDRGNSMLRPLQSCYVLTIPDLSRTCERELMWYTMAQAFPFFWTLI